MRTRLGLVLAALIVACSEPNGSTFDSEGTSAQAGSIPAGSFGGVCVPTASVPGGAVGTLDFAGGACGLGYGGRGTALSVRALVLAVRLGDSGELPKAGGAVDGTLATADVAGIVHVGLLHGAARSEGNAVLADASVADARIGIAGVNISAGVLQSNAKATCGDASGSSIIADLRVNGLTIKVTGEPNQTIAVGPVRIVINEQVKVGGAIVVHALHVSAAGIADVAIATSRASVDCPCGPPPTSSGSSASSSGSTSSSGGSSSGATSSGATSSGATSSGATSSGATSSGATSSGGSSSGNGGDDAPPKDFGQLGDACDDANKCTGGNHCAVGVPAVVR